MAIGWCLATLALAWVAGVVLHRQQRDLAPPGPCEAAVALGAAALLISWRWRRGVVVALVGTALLAWGASGWRANGVLADALPAVLEGQDFGVTGVIASLPQRSASGLRFRFEAESAVQDEWGWRAEIARILALRSPHSLFREKHKLDQRCPGRRAGG